MVRRILLLSILGVGAIASTGCWHRRACRPCGESIFPGRRAALAPATPVGFEGSPGIGAAPGCTSCAGGAGMPIAGSPSGYQPHYSGSGIPHDSVLLPNPTVLPPGTGTPRIDVDPPKPMPMTSGK